MNSFSLEDLGWAPFFEQHFENLKEADWQPARVIREDRERYQVLAADGEYAAEITGRLRHQAQSRADFPAVGDWVALAPRPGERAGSIHAVLPRLTCFSRKAAGEEIVEQVLAANVDIALLVSALDHDFNPRRIERYLLAATDSGANAVIVLNKADCCSDVPAAIRAVEALARQTPIHVVSAKTGAGLAELRPYVGRGQTAVLLGSSGVGKSTLLNALLDEDRQRTTEVREHDQRGRHTTSHRELFHLPGGGILMDVPGLRELTLWGGAEQISATFEDVEALASSCRFGDCQHQQEPGCAVRAALENGTLDAGRLENYRKLQRELAHLERAQDLRAREAERQRWKQIAVAQRKLKNERARWKL